MSNNFVSLSDYKGTHIMKSFKNVNNLIAKKVSVVRNGKTFYQTVWIKPEDKNNQNKIKDGQISLEQSNHSLLMSTKAKDKKEADERKFEADIYYNLYKKSVKR